MCSLRQFLDKYVYSHYCTVWNMTSNIHGYPYASRIINHCRMAYTSNFHPSATNFASIRWPFFNWQFLSTYRICFPISCCASRLLVGYDHYEAIYTTYESRVETFRKWLSFELEYHWSKQKRQKVHCLQLHFVYLKNCHSNFCMMSSKNKQGT